MIRIIKILLPIIITGFIAFLLYQFNKDSYETLFAVLCLINVLMLIWKKKKINYIIVAIISAILSIVGFYIK